MRFDIQARAQDGVPRGEMYPYVQALLEEQLGLKLERQRGEVEVLVIDSVHELIEN